MSIFWSGFGWREVSTDFAQYWLAGERAHPCCPFGRPFKYLGKIFHFKSLNSEPKKEFESKLEKILAKISSLKVRSQTKLKIFSQYVPSQFNFELKIYNFPDAFLSGVVDRLCTKYIREWLEFPPSSCVTDWISSPTGFCGLGIPTFAQRAARMQLTKRHLLQSSKNQCIRELWEASKAQNVRVDSLLDGNNIQQASSMLRKSQTKDSLDHFLGLKSQGLLSKVVNETVTHKNILLWKQAIDSLPEHVFNFTRRAMMCQLATLHNLKIWNCATSNLCPNCGVDQTNKHVLSNCSSPDALARYTNRHNTILDIIAKWIVPKMKPNHSLFCDLRVPGSRQVCDLFNGPRPDLAIVSSSSIVIGELTVCHETNMLHSREYKLDKYSNLESAKSSEFRDRKVLVHTIEVSTLGFVVAEPNFFKFGGIPNFDPPLIKELGKAAVLASRDIFANR